jgi:uncharacterized protein with PIN domain
VGDCVAYALAAESGEPILDVGHGMALTDLERVAY